MMIDGERLILRVIKGISTLSDEIIVVTSEESKGLASFTARSVKVMADVYPGKGSLGGIYTGLRASSFFHSLVVACDMPFLNLALLRYLIDLAPGFDIVIPRLGNLIEPLHAVYSKNCLAPAERLLRSSQLKISDLLAQVKVRYVEKEEVDRFDPEHLSFFNINTRDDLKRARAIVAQRR